MKMGPILLSLCAAAVLVVPEIASARDSLGMFGNWGAFRDARVPRCYAIAMAEPSTLRREFQPYADVAIWPRRGVRNQVHFRLSRQVRPSGSILLIIGGVRFALTGGGAEAWATDRRMDAGIVAAMRSAASMTVSATDSAGNRFSNTWRLEGAASAMDAAAIGCARS